LAIPGLKPKNSKRSKQPKSKKPKRKPGRPAKTKSHPDDDGATLRRSGRKRKYRPVVIESDTDDDEPEREASMEIDENQIDEQKTQDDEYTAAFPVVVTTYDIIMRDRTHLEHYEWGYIVVDEGHRLKNLDCKLMKEIKKYSSAGRMILTGTPLHVRLARHFLAKFDLPQDQRTTLQSSGPFSTLFSQLFSKISIGSKNGSVFPISKIRCRPTSRRKSFPPYMPFSNRFC
jgi:ATP-dependent DNA helicase